MRLFLAVIPPEAVQRAAHTAAAGLAHPHDGVAWVRCENLHFTLRFMGDVEDDALVAAAAADAARGHAPFDAALGRAGAFPSPARARVLWLDLARGAGDMKALARSLDTALVAHGFESEARPFSPHLTLGRVREPGRDWTARLRDAGVEQDGAAFRVDRIAVVQSWLQRGGSVYTVRHEARLGG